MRQGRGTALGMAAGLLIVAAGVFAVAPAMAVTNGEIAAVTHSDGIFRVFTINPDGTSATLRMQGSAPAWSPDGSSLAYIDPTEHITIKTEDGIVHTGVAASGSEISSGARVDWSPDGMNLAFVRGTEVWVMHAAPPYDPVRLTGGRCGDYAPTWSPDSARIAYSEGCFGVITIMNADGTDKTPVPNPLGLEESRPDWSPDGTQFVFLGSGQGHTGVWVMNVDGTDQHFLTETVEFCCGSPDWAPDGTKIVFVATGERIDTINADGTGLAEVPTPSVASQPRWGTRQPGA